VCECISVFLARADWAAIATIVIAIFTCCLWFSTRKLWKTTNESVKLGRDEFIATHRPKLRVHSVYLEKLSNPITKITDNSCSHITYKIHCSIGKMEEALRPS